MRAPILSLVLFAGLLMAAGQRVYLRPDATPKYRIQKVTTGSKLDEPLQVTFEMITQGKTPVAVSLENFAFEIWLKGNSSSSYGDLVFSNTVPEVIIAHPKTNLLLIATITTNNFHRVWSYLGPGEYGIRISSGCRKSQYFDYEYMGQVHSDACEFVVK
jgi:hypothetical protein